MKKLHGFDFTCWQTLGMLGILLLCTAAIAAEPMFPSRPIRIVVPYPAGGSTDFVARLIGERLTEQMKQTVIVENKAGAGGIIGTQQIARSAPDGYTIGIGSSTNLAMVPATHSEVHYDAVRDLAALSSVVSMDLVLVTGLRTPGNTLPEFVAWATRQQSPVFLGTFGAGTSGHFAGFMLGKAAKIKFEPIHYRTVGDAMIGLISGDAHALLATPSVALPLVKAGKIRALATNGPTRSPAWLEVPTFQEAGYPEMQFSNWIGLVAPAGTPPEILNKLSGEVVKATNSPQVRAKLEEAGYRVIGNTRNEFAATIRKDVVMWSDLVKTTGFRH